MPHYSKIRANCGVIELSDAVLREKVVEIERKMR